jgi:hypothetical protein
MNHIMYTYKGKFHEIYKDWNLQRIEKVLTRLGASYWEIGFDSVKTPEWWNDLYTDATGQCFTDADPGL